MPAPKGRIVARPMVTRACGCVKEFQQFEGDRFSAERLAKFKSSRCPDCAATFVKELRTLAPVPKTQALKQLPAGTQVALTLGDDGNWAGSLAADGTTVELVGTFGAGAPAVVGALAQQWVDAIRRKEDK